MAARLPTRDWWHFGGGTDYGRRRKKPRGGQGQENGRSGRGLPAYQSRLLSPVSVHKDRCNARHGLAWYGARTVASHYRIRV